MRSSRFTLAVVSALILQASAGAASGPPTRDESTDLAPVTSNKPEETNAHLDQRLLALSRNRERRNPVSGPIVEGFDRRTDRVSVHVYAAPGTEDAVATRLSNGGATDVVTVGDVVFAEVPVNALVSLSGGSDIRFIAPSFIPFAEVTGEGVESIAADGWHVDGATGAGVKIAIIDLGFDGYETLLGSELPGKVHTHDECGGMGSPEDHGTAVAEIVHEVAPHATLYLMCIENSNDLALAVDYAIKQGVTVISHSVGWFNSGRGDGTGAIGSIVQEARSAGILWINSAGNYAEQHWGGAMLDVDTDDVLEFDGSGDETITFTLSPQQTVTAYLRWDDWPASDNDYDLYLLDAAADLNSPVAEGSGLQNGSQDPTEALSFTNTGSSAVFHLAIDRFSAADTPEMDLFVFGLNPGQLPMDNNVSARSLNDPSTSPNVTAVGAVYWLSGIIEDFSSRGPTVDGRVKPDLAAPDGVDNDTFGSFFGTSAAAPHVSGAAALLRGADFDACLTPLALHNLVIGNTDAVGSPVPNNTYGHGRLDLGTAPTPHDSVIRYAGANRYATAADASAADFPCGTRTVFVATGEGFADALAGAAVAARFNAPILLVTKNSIPTETIAELERLVPDDVVILGGTAAVSAAVATALGSYGTVTRLAGGDRYETAVEISQYAFPSTVSDVFIATGTGFADALAGGPAAAFRDGPVLLTTPDALQPATRAEIERLQPMNVWVLGGPGTVSSAIVSELVDMGFPTARIFGADRYATAVATSELAFTGPTLETNGAIVHRVYIAVGTNFPDALAGGALAALRLGPVLLVQPDNVPQAVIDEITRLAPHQIVILGGTGVISAGVEQTLESLIG